MAANQGTVSRYIVLGFKFQFPSNGYSCNITDFDFSFYGKVRVYDLRLCGIVILDFHFSRGNLESDFGFYATVRDLFLDFFYLSTITVIILVVEVYFFV